MALRTTLATLLIAIAGSLVALWFGLPAAALVGGTLAVAIAATAGVNVAVPDGLRNAAFTLIGVNLGAGITSHILSDIAQWPASLAAMAVTLMLSMLAAGWILVRVFGFSPPGAVLATAPGALSYVIALAAERPDEARSVMVLQSLRLFVITLALPQIIAAVDGQGGGAAVAAVAELNWWQGALVVIAGIAAGRAGTRLGLPAAYLLAGFAVSGLAHGAGWVEGRIPPEASMAGFAVAGAVVGARFRGLTRRDLARYGLAGITASLVGISLTGCASFVLAPLLNLSPGQIWVAYAPGGVEAMAGMALSLDYDPVFVATHHICRLLGLLLILPLVLRWADAPRTRRRRN